MDEIREIIKRVIDIWMNNDNDTAKTLLENISNVVESALQSAREELETAKMCLANEEQAHSETKEKLIQAKNNAMEALELYEDVYHERDTLKAALYRAEQLIRMNGVPETRAKSVAKGIEVLISRFTKEIQAERAEAARMREAIVEYLKYNAPSHRTDYSSEGWKARRELEAILTSPAAPEKAETDEKTIKE